MKEKIILEEAQELLLKKTHAAGVTQVPLCQAYGRILSSDMAADRSVPPFDKSPLDGYALRAEDIKMASRFNPVRLIVIEEVRAGGMAVHSIEAGQAIKITTGSPIPAGADLVIKFEELNVMDGCIEVYKPLKSGSNIIYSGEDIQQGEKIAIKGTVVTPALAGLLASLGIARIPVYERPKVAVFSTGDELLDPGADWSPGKIYNSNLYGLEACCQQLGAETMTMGTAADIQEAVAAQFLRSLAGNDLVISTGGVSVGEYDVVKDALISIGAEILFWKLAIKPGSAAIAASKNGKLIIGLSGNPAAAMVTFDLLVMPLLKKMRGEKQVLPARINVRLQDSFPKSSPTRRFLRAQLHRSNGFDFASLNGAQGNGVLKSMLDCNILLDIPAGSGALRSGQEVSGLLVGDINASYVRELSALQVVPKLILQG